MATKRRKNSKFNYKKMFKVISLSLLSILAGLSLSYTAVNAPELHESYLINKLSPSVVKITSLSNENSGGTGFQMETKKGPKIITNAHVCLGAQQDGYVLIHSKTPIFISKILKLDLISDLCMLEGHSDLTTLSLGSKPKHRQEIAVLGHPILQPKTFSKGRVIGTSLLKVGSQIKEDSECNEPGSKVEQIFIFKICISPKIGTLTSAVIYPGNSGSPVVNFLGNVVGVIFAGNSTTNYGVMVPYENLKKFIGE